MAEGRVRIGNESCPAPEAEGGLPNGWHTAWRATAPLHAGNARAEHRSCALPTVTHACHPTFMQLTALRLHAVGTVLPRNVGDTNICANSVSSAVVERGLPLRVTREMAARSLGSCPRRRSSERPPVSSSPENHPTRVGARPWRRCCWMRTATSAAAGCVRRGSMPWLLLIFVLPFMKTFDGTLRSHRTSRFNPASRSSQFVYLRPSLAPRGRSISSIEHSTTRPVTRRISTLCRISSNRYVRYQPSANSENSL